MLIFLAHFSSCLGGLSLWVAQRIALDKVLKGNLLGNENPRNLQTSVKKSNTSSSGQNLHRNKYIGKENLAEFVWSQLPYTHHFTK